MVNGDGIPQINPNPIFAIPLRIEPCRPDCDCIVRDGGHPDEIQLYCIEGKKESEPRLRKQFDEKYGHFTEGVSYAIAFSVVKGKSIRFRFQKLEVVKYGDLKSKRIGRLLHPYLTRIQQRYGLFLQRQGLPRIPVEAVPKEHSPDIHTGD